MLKRGDIDSLCNKMQGKDHSVSNKESLLIVDLCKYFFMTEVNEDLGSLIGKLEAVAERVETQSQIVMAFEARFQAIHGRLDNIHSGYSDLYSFIIRKRWWQFWR